MQVIAGMKKHISIDDFCERLVVVILNLKPAKLAGKLSEAMILAAVHARADGSELVHPLSPPGLYTARLQARCHDHGQSQIQALSKGQMEIRNMSAAAKSAEIDSHATSACCLWGQPVHASKIATATTATEPMAHADGSSPGDAIHVEGISGGAATPKVLKSEHWRTIAAELTVLEGKAVYKGQQLQTAQGAIVVHSDIPNGSSIR